MLEWQHARQKGNAMKSNRYVAILLLACGSFLIAGCGDDPVRPETGFILVTVKDVSGPPVADVEIRIPAAGLTSTTDPEGVALFEVVPGHYFVEANLCCAGPGFIDYHVPVTVAGGKTETVVLQSCLDCV